MIVDFHNHLIPRRYLKELENSRSYPSYRRDASRRELLYGSPILPPHVLMEHMYDEEKQIKYMDKAGVDVAALSLDIYNHITEERGLHLATLVNEEFVKVVEKHPDRFTALAVVPHNFGSNLADVLDMLEVMVKDRGMRGLYLHSNVAGKPLTLPIFQEFWDKVAKLDVPVLLHPMNPPALETMVEFRLSHMVGLPSETAFTVARLAFSGLLQRHPNLKIVTAHCGGTWPYLVGRLDAGYRQFPECKTYIKEAPSTYLKKLYVDTISLHKPALECALSFLGAERMVFGSDFPFPWAPREDFLASVKGLDIPEEDKGRILGGNAARLLRI